jgi:serine/threonine-protein kinase RIO1
MVTLCDDKQTGNLKRLIERGIPCTKPLCVKQNVLLMTFIDLGTMSDPRLKDSNLVEQTDRLNLETIS